MGKKKCECDTIGALNEIISGMYDEKTELPFVDHEPNECKCTNKLKRYMRKGKKLWLCSCCCLSTDKEIKRK